MPALQAEHAQHELKVKVSQGMQEAGPGMGNALV